MIVGKSLLIERKTLDQFGGFAYFTDVLAEDHWLGETFCPERFFRALQLYMGRYHQGDFDG